MPVENPRSQAFHSPGVRTEAVRPIGPIAHKSIDNAGVKGADIFKAPAGPLRSAGFSAVCEC
jgi:hypothetical protein